MIIKIIEDWNIYYSHFPKFDLDWDFQSFSLYLQFFQLNTKLLLNNAGKTFEIFSKRIYKNQLHVNKRSIQEYEKQYAIKYFVKV